ncbi:unnamed protein product, partial [Cladocopium goreaui]
MASQASDDGGEKTVDFTKNRANERGMPGIAQWLRDFKNAGDGTAKPDMFMIRRLRQLIWLQTERQIFGENEQCWMRTQCVDRGGGVRDTIDQDADNGQTGNNAPSHTTSQTPSERSRSDKREVRVPLPPGQVLCTVAVICISKCGKPPGPDPPDDDRDSQADRDSKRGKDNRGKKPPPGSRRPPGGFIEEEDSPPSPDLYDEEYEDDAIPVPMRPPMKKAVHQLTGRIEFPCRKRADAIRDGSLKPNQLCDEQDALPPPEEQACAVAGRPAILERITQWESVVNTLKAAIAVATWDDPQVLLREMEGCRLPLANIVEPMLGGGNAEGAYDTLAEVYKNTPDGFLAMCPYPPGGEVDLLIVSDSSLALVPDPQAGKASCFSGGDLLKPWGDIRGIYTKMLWGKGLNHMVQYIPEAIDDIESTNRAHGRPVLPVLVIVHLEDDDINRKYVTNFLQAVADCHLAYLKLISVDDHLRTLPRIDDLQEQKNYPNLTILKAACQLEIDSNVSSPKDLPQRPDPEKLMLDADIEIFNWVLQAEESATASADREVESWLRDIPEEDQALEPMHHDNADSDNEAVKVQALTMDDRILARRKGLSEEHDQEWQDATYAAEDEDEDFKGWDLIEDDKRPPGVVASDPVHEEEKELDLDDLETVASVEIVDEEEFHDAEEGQAEPIDDDDDDMAVIEKVSSMQASKSDARGDPEPMDVDDQGNKMVQSTASAKTWKTEMAQSSSSAKTWKTDMAQSTSSAKTWRTDTTAAASAGATPSDPTSKLKPKKKAMPKRLKVVDEGHGPSAEQFDTSKFASAQDLVWIEPDNMAGVPVRKVDYGRLGSISHAMSDYLRGHRMFHRRPSPEIRRTDLSMDFKALVRHLQGDFAHLREEEVLMVVRNSPMRRFRVQVNGLSSGKLRWTPV